MTAATRLAWGLWGTFLVTLVGAIYIGMNPARGPAIGVFDALWAGSFIGFPTVGAVVVSRFPRRPLGWILCVGPLTLILAVLLSELSEHGIAAPSRAWEWIAWSGEVLFAVSLTLIVTIPLLLPEGNLPSRRWRPLVWGIVAAGTSMVLHSALEPGFYEDREPLANPIGAEALRDVLDAVEGRAETVLLFLLIPSALSLGTRFRSARGAERQQLKWLAMGALAIVAAIAVVTLLGAIGFSNGYVETLLSIVMILALPVSIGMAVRRDRLYEVDTLINRTIVYLVLTAVLAVAYLGIVLLLQRIFEPFTADSDLAVAGSTLAVAALFRPARSRIQTFIDRRFYRRKYDAAETLEAFSGRLRDQVDIESLRRELVDVVGATIQPAHASLWLRPGDAS